MSATVRRRQKRYGDRSGVSSIFLRLWRVFVALWASHGQLGSNYCKQALHSRPGQ